MEGTCVSIWKERDEIDTPYGYMECTCVTLLNELTPYLEHPVLL